MPHDTLFSATHCERCGAKLTVRTVSWFTTQTICMGCSKKEDAIKEKLRAFGYSTALEGCGYVPVEGMDYPEQKGN